MTGKIQRIVQVVPFLSDKASGLLQAVPPLCESLVSEGESVDLLTLNYGIVDAPPLFLRQFDLSVGPRKLGRSTAMRRWMNKAAREDRIRLIHVHSLWMMPNVYPGWVARKFRIPLVVSPHGTFSVTAMNSGSAMKKIFWPLLQRPAIIGANCFHATAESEYRDIRRLGFRQPVAIIPNGVQIPELPPKEPSERRTLLFLGRIHPIKGLDMLLPAWGAVQDQFPEWRLLVVGPDNIGHLAQMRQLAEKLKLERIQFIGGIFGEQKWKAYRDADLYVLPSYTENFGISVAEALAAETPAIVTKGAPWQALDARGAGWWIDIGIDPLVACLEKAMSQSPEALRKMGLQGRAWMEAAFSWRQIGRQMSQTYRWTIEGGTPPECLRLD